MRPSETEADCKQKRKTYQGQEHDRYKVLKLLDDRDRVSVLVRDDEAREEAAEDRVHARDVREECADEHEEERESHHERRRLPALEAARALRDPDVRGLDGEEQEQDEGDVDEQDVDSLHAGTGVDERDSQREQDPADDVVADTGRQRHGPDGRVEQLGFREDPAQNGESLNLVSTAAPRGHGKHGDEL
jgi:hypothetical protein